MCDEGVTRHHEYTLFPYTTLFRSHLETSLPSWARRTISWLYSTPMSPRAPRAPFSARRSPVASSTPVWRRGTWSVLPRRSEEHTSELQSRPHLVCRLLLDNNKIIG